MIKKIELFKSLLVDGLEVKEIEFNLNKVKGKNAFEVFKSLIKGGYPVSSYNTDPVFLINIMAEASNMAYEDLARLDLKSYSKVVDYARDYINNGLSDVDCDTTYLKLNTPIVAQNDNQEAIEVKELKFNLDELNGLDVQNSIKFIGRRGYIISSSYELDPIVGISLMSKASGVSFDDCLKLDILDFLAAGALVRDFFITGLSGSQAENNLTE